MNPEGRGYELPDPESFRGVEEFTGAFSPQRLHGEPSPSENYSYGDGDNNYVPRSSDELRRFSEDESLAPTKSGGRGKKVAIFLGAAAVVCGLGVGATFAVPEIITSVSSAVSPTEETPSKEPHSDGEPVATEVSIPALPVDGWTRDSHTKINLREKAAPITMTNGLVAAITEDGYLYVVDPTTGEPVFGSSVANASGVVTYKSNDGQDSVAWRSGTEVYTWDQKHGEQSYSFTDTSRLYSSGSSPIVWERGSSTASILLPGGQQKDVTMPDGTVPVGVSNGELLISASAANPVWVTNLETDETSHITLATPKEGMVIRKWVGMSNGNVVVVWSSPGKMAASSRVNVTVHSVKDGSVIATQDVDWGSVDEENLVPDQTRTKFAVGYVAFDGKAFTAADDAKVRITSYAGDRLYAKNGDVAGEVVNGKWTALPDGTATPLGIGHDGEAIIKINRTAYALIQEGK